MRHYWVTFTDMTAGTVDAPDAETAGAVAELLTSKRVGAAAVLPYPALPIIWQASAIPAFCLSPNSCAGRASCPRRYSCVD